MRFRRLRVAVFGPLEDRDFELRADRVLVHGANTSGKTSFRAALETALYGFDPARRDTHPLWIWNEGDDLHLEADLEPERGAPFRLERTLQTTGKHRRAAAGEEFAGTRLGNASLPEVAGTSREMFRAVYGLSLADLDEFDAALSEDIDRLLLPAQEGVRLRASRDVMHELEGEHAGLWHRDKRRGKAAKQIVGEKRLLRQQLRQARDSEDALREAHAEYGAIEERLPKIDEERRTAESETHDALALKKIFDWRRQSAQLPEPPDLGPLGEAGLQDPQQLRSVIDAGEAELEPHLNRLRLLPVTLTEVEQRVLNCADAIKATESGRHDQQGEDLEDRVAHARKLKQRLLQDLGYLLAVQPDAAHLRLFRNVSLDVIDAAVDDWADAAAQQAAVGAVDIRRRNVGFGLLLAGVALVIVGTIAAFGEIDSSFAWLAGIGGVFAGAGGAVLWFVRNAGIVASTPPPCPSVLREAAESLPIHPAMIATPVAARKMYERMRQLLPGLTDLDALEVDIESLTRKLEERVASWIALIEKIGVEPVGESERLAQQLLDLLERARKAEQEAQKDAYEREVAQRVIDERTPGLDRRRGRLELLTRILMEAVPNETDLEAAYEQLKAREERRRQLAEEGERLQLEPDFEKLHGRLPDDPLASPDPQPWNDDVTRARDERLEALKRERDEKLQRRGELEQLLRDAKGSEAARIREQLDALDERLREVKVARDRLAMLERILREADRQYRDEHQPDVLRNANRYLETVTGGTMKRLEYGGDGGRVLFVTPEGRDEPVPVEPPLSRGTCDQIHLCLRLGLLDHLDKDGEPLPLVLDELLVNWDAVRRARIYPLLRLVSQTRQVFLLTCHDSFAVEAERELGIARIEL